MNESKLRRLRDRTGGAATLINHGCKISGEISGSGDFMISGEVAGDCNVSGTVTLAVNGLWQGTIQADNVIVAGHVEGDIAAHGKVEITDTARITGTVTGEAIAVAEGAVVEGVMKTNNQSAPQEFVEKRNN
ncbi:MAG: polymer-forming cytoskeletal protein [Gammaproteobacteria bacterium]|nr:polymer-forming cytoskeletal protein [Gammaproteobacteria bacterium]